MKKGVTVNLGAIDLDPRELTNLQVGSTIEIDAPTSLTGALEVDGASFAEVDITLHQGRLVLLVKKITESD